MKVAVPPGNVQAGARAARYAALDKWHRDVGAAALLTAHHADDQAETLLMRLNRGSGVSGLAGIRQKTHIPQSRGLLLRPLLGWTKSELEQIVADAGITPVRDPSNEDDRFDRARLRKALADADWLDTRSLALSALNLQDTDDALDQLAQDEWEKCTAPDQDALIYRPRYMQISVAARVICRAMEHLGSKASMPSAVQLAQALNRDETANAGGILATPKADAWELRREPPRASS